MMRWLMVLPAIDPVSTAECLETMRIDLDSVMVVNNSPDAMRLPVDVGRYEDRRTNIGVAASWNLARAEVIRCELDMLLLCSTSMRFGPPGGQDLIDQLDQANEWGIETVGNGWHLTGLTRRTLELVGSFDEGFWPAYFEDQDYLYRMGLAGIPSPRENDQSQPYVVVDGAPVRDAHTILSGVVHVDFGPLERRYAAKWGGAQGHERFIAPWNAAL